MFRFIVFIVGLSLAGHLNAEAQKVKKLKGFEANCDAAIVLFIDSDVNGEEFYEYMMTAHKLTNAYHEAAKKQFDRSDDSIRYARSLLKTAFVKLMMLDNGQDPVLQKSGMDDFETSMRLARRDKIKNELLPVYFVLIRLDFAQDSDRIVDDMESIRTLAGDSSYYYLNVLAVFNRNNGRFLKAEEIALRTKQKAKPASSELYQINRLLEDIYATLGESEKGLRVAEENLSLIASRGRRNHQEYYWAVLELIEHYMEMAQWDRARKLYQQNIRDMTRDKDTRELYDETRVLFVTYYNLMWLNYDTGEKTAADSLFRLQKQVADHFSNRTDDLYADICSMLSSYYADAKHDYDSAIVMEKIVLDFGRTTRFKPYEMAASAELSHLYRRKKDYLTATVYIDSALAMADKLRRPNSYTNYLVRKAKVLEKQGRLTDAEKLFRQADDAIVARYGEGSSQRMDIQGVLAFFYLRSKAMRNAEPFFLEDIDAAMDKISRTFAGLTESEREAQSLVVYEDKFNDFNYFAMQRCAAKPELAGKMYDVRLFTKGLLLTSAGKWKQRIISSGDLRLLNEFNLWQQSKEKLMRLDNLSAAEQKLQGVDKDSLEVATIELERKLQQRSEFFARINDRKRYSWTDVQKVLKSGEAAVEMIRIKKNDSDESSDSIYYAALIVTSKSAFPELLVLPNGKRMEAAGAYYQNCMLFKAVDTLSYALYWKTLGDLLKRRNITRVIFSPDGVYNNISLNTLYNPSSKKYLIDEWTIHMVTNTKDIIPVERREEAYNNYAILIGYPNYALGSTQRKQKAPPQGNFVRSASPQMAFTGSVPPLEGTRVEVEDIAKQLREKGWQPEVYIGDDALEENIKASFKPQILHLATHGYFQKTMDTRKRVNPLLNTGLLLAGAEQTLAKSKTDESLEDGILTAYEAMNLNLENTQLVVLSACETGKGELKMGEGVYGLQRAFMVAGARSVVMSLWVVSDDATHELMSSFYSLWLGGMNRRDAFRDAQLQLRKKYSHPYYWGAFVMIGE